MEFQHTKSLYAKSKSCVTHLECAMNGERYEAGIPHGLSKIGKPIIVKYDLEKLAKSVTKEQIEKREGGFWKYREFLPVNMAENVVSLGEVMTPLIPLNHCVPKGCNVIVKDEGRLPTGSFKARGLALAVAMAKELGQTHLAMPTNGNAGAALAAYASYGGLKNHRILPRRYTRSEYPRNRASRRNRI